MMNELKALLAGPPRLTLALAESVTCGLVQAKVGEVSGASDFFLGGITAYSLQAKVHQLGVEAARAKEVNGVSEQVALQMARGACKLFGSDLALATTGYAEPSAEWQVATPFAWWALAHVRPAQETFTLTGRLECPQRPRTDVQERVASSVLAVLLQYVRQLRGN
jgi:nicotinamide-nucleotide amidase